MPTSIVRKLSLNVTSRAVERAPPRVLSLDPSETNVANIPKHPSNPSGLPVALKNNSVITKFKRDNTMFAVAISMTSTSKLS